MDHQKLLLFLSQVITIREKSGTADRDLFDCLQHFTRKPLADFVALALETEQPFEEFHAEILSAFIPSRIANQLRFDTVNRLQGEEEPLASYVQEMRMQAEVLQMNMSERQLVDTIVANLNVKTRSLLSYEARPRTLQGLLQLCVSAQDYQLADARRPKGSSRNSFASLFYNADRQELPKPRVHAVQVPCAPAQTSTCNQAISGNVQTLPGMVFSDPPAQPRAPNVTQPPPSFARPAVPIPPAPHRSRGVQCYLCNQYGHVVRDCPSRPKN